MLRSGFIVATTLVLCTAAARGADATNPVDYRQRNETYAPAGAVQPAPGPPPRAGGMQDRRLEKNVIEKAPAGVGERRAAVPVAEIRPKAVHEKSSTRPKAAEVPRSAFDQRPAPIATSDVEKPPTVARYQDSLSAASASNMARFPAHGAATAATLNRFVFRRNGPEATGGAPPAPVTRAAGDSTAEK